jgi:manganese transport protein
MDPGNWATDIEAGSRFGYRLLWVLLLSNLLAVLLQTLATRLGIVTGRDLAQACRENYPRWTGVCLYVLCEVAIAACDLAEVIGTLIALNLLFSLPYIWGLAVAAADTFLLLALQRRGIRVLELVTLALIGVIGGSFLVEIVLARPNWLEVMGGFVPALDTQDAAHLHKSLYVAIGMLGATVMPHNLYLHSALVQTRSYPLTPAGKRVACKYNLADSLLALNGAFLVNAAILVLSVATFFAHGFVVEKLQDAHQLLEKVWGTALASGLFAVALLASGQSSTLTGTLAGQVVMEGFVRLRLRPWVRRLLTRCAALLPALAAIAFAQNEGLWGAGNVDERLLGLLVLSQVILSLQLPFAIVPLIHFTSDQRKMGEFASGTWLKAMSWSCAGLVVALNAFLIFLQVSEWTEGASSWVYGTVIPATCVLGTFLIWITIYPLRGRVEERRIPLLTRELEVVQYRRVGAAVELEGGDEPLLAQAAAIIRANHGQLVILHVVEGTGATLFGPETADQESRHDQERMAELTDHLQRHGLDARGMLGYGSPAEELIRMAHEQRLDLLVVGTHGHRLLADLALGQTVNPMLHKLSIPVLVVPSRPIMRAST